MSTTFVNSQQVMNENAQNFTFPTNPDGIFKQLNCFNTQVLASYWMVPMKQGNRVVGYNFIIATDAVKPTPDSFKVQRLKTLGESGPTTLHIAILDSDNIATSSPANYFAYLCDGNDGTVPTMPFVVIPAPVLQTGPSSTTPGGTRVFTYAFPANPNARRYEIPYPWFNGIAPTPAYAPGTIVTAAQFVTWANTNWGEYGTWASTGDIVTVTNTNSSTVPLSLSGMTIDLEPVHYCLTLNSTPELVNGIKISGTVYAITPMYASTANRQELINAIKPFLRYAVFSTSVATKVDTLTIQKPEALTFNGTNISGRTFASGVCS